MLKTTTVRRGHSHHQAEDRETKAAGKKEKKEKKVEFLKHLCCKEQLLLVEHGFYSLHDLCA
jgi:hypothetical protein